jgi:hypothetical protein
MATKQITEKVDPQLELLKSISTGISNLGEEVRTTKDTLEALASRVDSIEKGGKDDFKKGATVADVAAAAEHRKGIDPKIIAIVDETLGTDFGIKLAPMGNDQLGYMFTLVVPKRMNDQPVEKRPVRDPITGEYKKDALGNVQTESFQRPDERSKPIASAEGYGAIREHCEKVRAYIAAYYASKKQPMPALHVK